MLKGLSYNTQVFLNQCTSNTISKRNNHLSLQTVFVSDLQLYLCNALVPRHTIQHSTETAQQKRRILMDDVSLYQYIQTLILKKSLGFNASFLLFNDFCFVNVTTSVLLLWHTSGQQSDGHVAGKWSLISKHLSY